MNRGALILGIVGACLGAVALLVWQPWRSTSDGPDSDSVSAATDARQSAAARVAASLDVAMVSRQAGAVPAAAFREHVSEALSMYTSGDPDALIAFLQSIRPPEAHRPYWDDPAKRAHAAEVYRWLNASLRLREGPAEVLPWRVRGQKQTADNGPQGGSFATGEWTDTLPLFSEPLERQFAYEVRLPTSYVTPDGVEQRTSFSLIMQWSNQDSRWIPIGYRWMNFPVGQPFPAMPY